MIARVTYVMLAVIVLGLALSCGGGSQKATGTLPAVSSSTGIGSASSGELDRSACIPEDEIYRLSPILQELYSDPGWDGPPTPMGEPARQAQSVDVVMGEESMATAGVPGEETAARGVEVPPPPPLDLEVIAARYEGEARVDRGAEPVVPVKGASYPYIPPADGQYKDPGEYDPDDWSGGTGDPPWGSDDDPDDDLEDRIQKVSWADELGKSCVKLGKTDVNQFNRGWSVESDLSAVYQTYVVPMGGENRWGEWSYPSGETYDVVAEPAYVVDGYIYLKIQMKTSVKRYSQMSDFSWYDILIAPVDEVSAAYMSTRPPNETYAKYQPYYYDEESMPYGQAWMVDMVSSANETIQEYIDNREDLSEEERGEIMQFMSFPIFGLIHRRWADDVWVMDVDPPWEGRLGWPLSDPFIDRDGRLLTGPLGPFYRYGQYFEKGFMWHYDYIEPATPDEVYVFMYDEDSTLEGGGEYVQDPQVVRYGMGGPLGCTVFVNPLTANIGDPIYFKAFPYGGPTDNANGFEDDWFLWNFRDGTVTPGSIQYPVHSYLVEGLYKARLMFTIDYDGDGNPDGLTEGYKIFVDSPEFLIGHLGEPGSGTGGITTLVVQDTTAPSGNDSLEHVQAFTGDLDAAGFDDIYEVTTTTDITDVSDMEDYLLVIWCPPQSTNMYAFFEMQFDNGERQRITDYIMGGGNVWLSTRCIWNNYGGVPQWPMLFGFQGNNGWLSWGYGQNGAVNLNPSNTGSGPAGAIAQIFMPEAQYMQTNFSFTWDYEMPAGAEILGRYSMYTNRVPWASMDNLPGEDGGRGVLYGYAWNHVEEESNPPGPGRAGAVWNCLDFIDPMILEGGGGGGGGGEYPILPYEGPVDIADTFAWVYAADGSEISGGDGDTAPNRASVTITTLTGPQSIWFEAQARASEGIDLVYEWSFEPGDPYAMWTKYTSHSYVGAVDPDGPAGPQAPGDPFPVYVRTFDSTFGTYDAAPPEARDSDSVLVEVHGPTPVDIEDDGTVFENPYSLNPDGSIDVTLHYRIDEGVEPYDHVYIDYDYDFVTFDEPPAAGTVEVTPTPGQGSSTYVLNIPDVESGKEYFIAIKVIDVDSANGEDTYAWLDPVKGGADICVVNDGGTSNYNSIKSDLNDLGAGYTELNSSDVSSVSDLTPYKVVIWCCSSSSYRISTTEANILYSYVVTNGGNLFVPYNYLYYTGLTSSQRQMFGYSSLYSWYASGYISVYGGNSYGNYGGNPYVARSGVGGGTVTGVNCNYISPLTDVYYYYRRPNTRDILGENGFDPYYIDGAMRDNGTAGDNQGWAAWTPNWEYLTGTRGDTSVGTKGVLWRIIEKMDPDIIN